MLSLSGAAHRRCGKRHVLPASGKKAYALGSQPGLAIGGAGVSVRNGMPGRADRIGIRSEEGKP